jgi:hypothetical protein
MYYNSLTEMAYQHKGKKGSNRMFTGEIPTMKIKEIIHEARNVSFPWEAISSPVRPWIEAMARAINTQPEFVLLEALTVTSCLMGPDCVFEIRNRHKEPCNIFTLCLCEPGTGKTQAYKVSVEDPLQALPIKVLVHDYTQKGLFEHLNSRGRALICHGEMSSFYENLLKRQTEGNGERQMFCRFHDGNSKIIRTSHGKGSKKEGALQDEREELEKSCLSLGGFCQPQPYLNLHHMLGTSDDGFLDRISTCLVDSVILREKEVDQWNDILDTFNITAFDGMFCNICIHHKSPEKIFYLKKKLFCNALTCINGLKD